MSIARLSSSSGRPGRRAGGRWVVAMVRAQRPAALLGTMLVLAHLAAFLLWSAEFRARTLVAAQAQMASSGRFVAIMVMSTIQATATWREKVANGYAALLARGADAAALDAWTETVIRDGPPSRPTMAVVDAAGRLLRSTAASAPAAPSFADTPSFAMLRGGAADVMSSLYRSRFTGTPVFSHARRLAGPDGSFLGMFVVEYNAIAQAAALRFILQNPDWVIDWRYGAPGSSSGVTLSTTAPGRAIDPPDMAASAVQPTQGFDWRKLATHDDSDARSIATTVAVPGTPYSVRFTISRAKALEGWRQIVTEVGCAVLIMLALELFLLWRLGRLILANQQKATALQRAVDVVRLTQAAANVGIWSYDPAKNRLTLPLFAAGSLPDGPPGDSIAAAGNDPLGERGIELGLEGFIAIVHPGDRLAARTALRQMRWLEELEEFEIRLRIGAEWRWVRFKGALRQGDQGDGRVVLGTLLDVHARKTAELAQATALNRLLDAQEQERLRVARDLHDEFGHRIFGVSLALERAQAQAREPALRASVDTAIEATNAFATGISGMIAQLRLGDMEESGLVPALQELCARWSQRSGVQAQFDLVGKLPERQDIAAAIALYRAVQEALTNVARHAEASQVSVILEAREDIRICIEDNGRGFDPEIIADERPHHGLIGMRERLLAFGGRMEIESSPGHGTSVFLTMPAVALAAG